jgi:DNA repair ATPase RecN
MSDFNQSIDEEGLFDELRERLRAKIGELKDERDDLRDLAERRRWGAEEMDRLRARVKELEEMLYPGAIGGE